MMNRDDLEIGQAMVVYEGVGRRSRRDAVVHNVARKYVTLEVWFGSNHTRMIEFDIESQRQRGADRSYAAIFRTTEADALAQRMRAAEDGLAKIGLYRRRPDALTLKEMEAVVLVVERLRQGMSIALEYGQMPGKEG
jgi:hypothetical protein